MNITLLPAGIYSTPYRIIVNLQWEMDMVYGWKRNLVKDGLIWSYQWELYVDVPFSSVFPRVNNWSPLDNIIPPCCGGNNQNLLLFKTWATDWGMGSIVRQTKANMLYDLRRRPSEWPPRPQQNGVPNEFDLCNRRTHRDIGNTNIEIPIVLIRKQNCDQTCQCTIKSVGGDWRLNLQPFQIQPINNCPGPVGVPYLQPLVPPLPTVFSVDLNTA